MMVMSIGSALVEAQKHWSHGYEIMSIQMDFKFFVLIATRPRKEIMEYARIKQNPSLAMSQEYEVRMALWDSINKKRGFGWEVNPWVWVVDFKVIEVKNGNKN